MAHSLLDEFHFRAYEAGPRRDTAQRFAMMAGDLDTLLPDGDDKDGMLRLLLEARACGMRAAETQLRPGQVEVVD